MTFESFKSSVALNRPPDNASPYLLSLWHDAKGNWEKAHTIIQDIDDRSASWIHAYLHRKEGDISNADYWYHRANKKRPNYSLEEEWNQIAREFLE